MLSMLSQYDMLTHDYDGKKRWNNDYYRWHTCSSVGICKHNHRVSSLCKSHSYAVFTADELN